MNPDGAAAMGRRRTVRSGPHATHRPGTPGTKKKSTTGKPWVDWAAEKPQPPLSLRYYAVVIHNSPPTKRAVVVDSYDHSRRVAGPMRCCEAVNKAHELNEQLRPKPKPKPKKRNHKHKK